ncbi:MAG: DUF5684 domain-containing protein [Candidatus Saccharimonadales bacterium]
MNIFSLFAQSYSYQTTDAANVAVTSALVGMVILFTILAAVISYAIGAFLTGRIFKKAGLEQWRAWVPIYSSWKLLELGGQQGFWAVLALVPIVNIVSAIFMYIAMYHIGLRLQKEGWFVLVAIFLPIVWLAWLAFDDSKWQKSDKKVLSTTPAES